MLRVWRAARRVKTLHTDFLHHTEWTRGLGVLDFMGIASVISFPLGVYVAVPYCAKYVAGPSCVLSALFAFVIATLTGMHMVELSVALPKSCLLYTFTYASFGELWAFLVGWMSFMDYSIATSHIAKAWSEHINHLFNSSLHSSMLLPFGGANSTVWTDNFDSLAFLGLSAACLLAILSVKIAGTVSLVLVIVCALVVSSSVLVGFFYADALNWVKPGFFKDGYFGVLRGTAQLTYAYIGLEALSYLLEEATHPQKRLPFVVSLCNLILSVYFFLLGLTITLALDYTKFPSSVLLPQIYGKISVPASRYVLSVGSVCGLSGTLVAILLPPTRLLRVMGVDGLLCKALGSLSRKSGSPHVAVPVTFFAVFCFLCLRSSSVVGILNVTLPFRLLLTTVITILERYTSSPIGFAPEVTSYRNMKKYRSTASFVTMNGSVVTLPHSDMMSPGDDSNISVNSSVICRNIAIAQMGSQSDFHVKATAEPPKETDVHERSSLLVPHAVNGAAKNPSTPTHPAGSRIVKSVSKYSAVTPVEENKPILKGAAAAGGQQDNASLHTVSLGGSCAQHGPHVHNCLKSPCSPHGEDAWLHLYERFTPELPYCDTSNGYCRPGTPTNQSRVHCKAVKLLVAYLCTCILAGILLVAGESALLAGSWWIAALLGAIVCVLAVIVWLFWRLEQNKDVAARQHRVPAFPFLSLLTCLFLCILICTNSIHSFVQVLCGVATGVLIYFSYGIRKSTENRTQHQEILIENMQTDHVPIVKRSNTGFSSALTE